MDQKCGNCQKNCIKKRHTANQLKWPSAAVHPINTGKAPGIAPTATAAGLYLLSGVYTYEYKINDKTPNTAVRGLNVARIMTPIIQAKPPNNTASATFILPAASGRSAVLDINLSKSFSKT